MKDQSITRQKNQYTNKSLDQLPDLLEICRFGAFESLVTSSPMQFSSSKSRFISDKSNLSWRHGFKKNAYYYGHQFNGCFTQTE